MLCPHTCKHRSTGSSSQEGGCTDATTATAAAPARPWRAQKHLRGSNKVLTCSVPSTTSSPAFSVQTLCFFRPQKPSPHPDRPTRVLRVSFPPYALPLFHLLSELCASFKILRVPSSRKPFLIRQVGFLSPSTL